MLELSEAKKKRLCRICGKPISVTSAPAGWTEEFDTMVFPEKLTLNFGKEFAHTICLEGLEKNTS